MRKESTPPIRRILVRFEPNKGCAAIDRAAEIAARERATIDICGVVKRHRTLHYLAMIGGAAPALPAQLEAQELEQLAEAMRRAVAEMPRNLGIRTFLLVGNPRPKMAELLAAGDYDLVI